MAYKDQTDLPYTDSEQWRMSNIVHELESRCKLLEEENKHLNESLHKCKTEYDVDTAYLKNKVANERERQIQWKSLYFEVHAELTDTKRKYIEIKRLNNSSNTKNDSNNNSKTTKNNNNSSKDNSQGKCSNDISSDNNNNNCSTFTDSNNNNTTIDKENNEYNNNNKNDNASPTNSRNNNNNTTIQGTDSNNNASWITSSSRHSHLVDSGCVECEKERKRKDSESEFARRHQTAIAASGFSSPSLHVSPNNTMKFEDSCTIPIFSSPHLSPRLPPPPQFSINPLQSPPPKLYECRACGVFYDSEQKLHFHTQIHAGSNHPPPQSTPSRTRNISMNDYPDSISSHSGLPSGDCYNCPECNQNYGTEDEYRRHLLLHMFKCRVCGMNVDSETNFVLHMKSHNESMPVFTCFLCDKPFSHVSQLTRHLLTHPDDMSFDCTECGKHFTRKAHLTRHMSMHSKCRPYVCKDCGKKFAHKTHLRRHEIVHSGLRPHQCKVCHQSFSRKSSLSRHYFIHTTEKPFVCPVCEKGFNRKGRLRNHLNIHIREGCPNLVDYVIERRMITREFIEKINQVKSDETENTDYSTMADIHGSASFSVKREPPDLDEAAGHESLTTYHGKEESDDSSCSDTDEGEIDELEADLSEEITFDQPPASKKNPVPSPPSSQLNPPFEGDIIKMSETPPPVTVVDETNMRLSEDIQKRSATIRQDTPTHQQQQPQHQHQQLYMSQVHSKDEPHSTTVYQMHPSSIYYPGLVPHPSEEMRLYDRLVPRPHHGENMRVFEEPPRNTSGNTPGRNETT